MSLRRWQTAIGVVILLSIATVFGFYEYARRQARSILRQLPGKLEANISQKAVGFTYSKSEGGRTLFTIKATELVQFKDGVHAELRGVSIIVYGRQGDRYDQIYGDKFSYDQKTQEVRADGPVSIDLQANPKTLMAKGDQSAPDEIKNPIHLKTSGLLFSQNTGIAQTKERIEFRTVEGEGSAVGATYDTHNGVIRFEHEVMLKTDAISPATRQTITASSATIEQTSQQDQERQARLEDVTIRSVDRITKAPELNLYFRDDNTLDRSRADRGIDTRSLTDRSESLSAKSATLLASGKNMIDRADLHGSVHIEDQGTISDSGSAVIRFGAKNAILAADLAGGATIRQPDGSQLNSQTLHLHFRSNRSLEQAFTDSQTSVTLLEKAARRTTAITANQMNASFDDGSHLKTLHAAGNTRTVSDEPNRTQRTTSSDVLDAAFTTEANKSALSRITEAGNVRIRDGSQAATAERADYNPATRNAVLTGSPRLSDTGMSVSAEKIEIEAATQHARAEGDVRLTYVQSKAQPGGGMLSGTEPVHAISASAIFSKRSSGDSIADLTGSPARIWQGASVIQSPQIKFDQAARTLTATGTTTYPVTTTFVQQDKTGKVVPVTVSAQSLRYFDAERRAQFENDVSVRGADGTITSQQISVLLYPAGKRGQGSATAGQVERISAFGNVKLDERDRHGAGERLIYTAADAKFVLTGTQNSAPSIFDAEHGSVTGDSLTFYSRDDKVLVESQGKRTVTHTHLTK